MFEGPDNRYDTDTNVPGSEIGMEILRISGGIQAPEPQKNGQMAIGNGIEFEFRFRTLKCSKYLKISRAHNFWLIVSSANTRIRAGRNTSRQLLVKSRFSRQK